MPELGTGSYLAEIWDEVGRYRTGVNGPAKFEWADIAGWQTCQNARLTPWEAGVVMAMSADFCACFHDSDRNAPPPHSPTDGPDDQAIERGHQNEYLMGGGNG